MEIAVETLFVGLNPEITSRKQRIAFQSRVSFSCRPRCYVQVRNFQEHRRRTRHKSFSVVHAVSQGLENNKVSETGFTDFRVEANTCEDREIQMRIDVFGAKTQAIFDDVFLKMVDAAQPIPGFRRVKGGKTPDIPKDILLHILGPSKINKQSIKKIINSTVAEYVKKKGLKVTKDLRIEQSFEELEAKFIPGKELSFDAVIQLQETGQN